MKQCRKCGEKKPYEEFGICKRYLDGYRHQCKECLRKYSNEWESRNQDKKRESRRKYRENNRQHIREMDREYYKNNSDKRREESRLKMKTYLERKGYETRAKFKEMFPERHKAREKIKSEVRAGRIKKPDYCQICSKKGTRIEAHHHDYEKPLEVIWLCASCHRGIHRKDIK